MKAPVMNCKYGQAKRKDGRELRHRPHTDSKVHESFSQDTFEDDVWLLGVWDHEGICCWLSPFGHGYHKGRELDEEAEFHERIFCSELCNSFTLNVSP